MADSNVSKMESSTPLSRYKLFIAMTNQNIAINY